MINDVRNPMMSQMRTASGLDIIAGIWLIISSWVLSYASHTTPFWNDVIIGAVIAVIALIRFFGAWRASWLSWINVVLGIWLIISPWVLGYTGIHAAAWNNVILGIIVIVLSWWSAMSTRAPLTTA